MNKYRFFFSSILFVRIRYTIWLKTGLKSLFSRRCASKIWGGVSEVRFKKNSTLSPWKRRKNNSSATFCATGVWGLKMLKQFSYWEQSSYCSELFDFSIYFDIPCLFGIFLSLWKNFLISREGYFKIRNSLFFLSFCPMTVSLLKMHIEYLSPGLFRPWKFHEFWMTSHIYTKDAA